MKKTPRLVLIILDGWGLAEIWGGNAIGLAQTPTMDFLLEKYPHTTLDASGEAVGLPYNEPGNSEVGHLNIGSGQIAYQGLSAINQMLKDNRFFANKTLLEIINKIKEQKRTLHLIGLVSDGGIHSHITHLYGLLEASKKAGLTKVNIHAFTDGRDTAPTNGINFIKKLEEKIDQLGTGNIATISGRYYGMDRDNRWDRIEKTYNAIVLGQGKTAKFAEAAIYASYREGITDEFILPTVINPEGRLHNHDGIIFFNFRSDRSRQLTRALCEEKFNGFYRQVICQNLICGTFASFQENLPVKVIFGMNKIDSPLAFILGKKGLNHLHIAETEKYAHVTYFFNGENEKPFLGEKRILVDSPKVATYDLQPEMSAEKVMKKTIENYPNFHFTVVNFANPDMVGHTGNMKATIQAIETVDGCLGQLIKKITDNGDIAFVTADHGNAENMINALTGQPDTEHTNNPVPFIVVKDGVQKTSLNTKGRLCDITPTILELCDIAKSSEMIGRNLISEPPRPYGRGIKNVGFFF